MNDRVSDQPDALALTKRDFMYAVNSMENAASHTDPHKHDYATKRKRVFAMYADLERQLAAVTADAKRYRWLRANIGTYIHDSRAP